jgi:oligoendopeptidase F
VVLDVPRMGITWARFSHLFTSFYVFQYATGISAAAALAGRIRHEGEPAVRRYIAFLESGGSVYPVDAIQQAGVDMRSPEPIQRAYDILEGYVARLEALADEG